MIQLIFKSWSAMVLQNYQNVLEVTSNMKYKVVFARGLKMST